MTERHDPPWGPDDDELVRAALLSLMDDVAAEPLPEPSAIRARAEGGGSAAGGTVVDLATRRRRRTLTAVAGVAAAALVAAGVGLLARDGTRTAPPASSTSSTAARPLTMLDARDWSTALGLDVTSTAATSQPAGQCFRITDSDTTTWTRSVATLADDRVVAGQWIGTTDDGGAAPTGASDDAVERCKDSFPTTQSITEDRPGDATFRAWHARGADGAGVWWVEASRGPSSAFLSVAELDGKTYTGDDMRALADAALGDADPATDSGTTSTTGTPSSTSEPGSTATSTVPTSPPSPTGTSAPSAPSDSPVPPTVPSSPAGPITDAAFVPSSEWVSGLLDDGTSVAPGDMGADVRVDACLGDVKAARTRARGHHVEGGDGQPFSYQKVFAADDAAGADELERTITAAHERSTCADGTTVTKVGSDVYRLQDGAGLVRWVAVTRMRSHAVSVVVLVGEALPGRLSDEDAAGALRRITGLAANL